MRINKNLVIKSVIYSFIFIFFIVLETNILNGVKIFGVKPNLIILLVIAASVAENERYASVLGLILGFITDSSVGSPFFFSGVYYFFAAYIAGTVTRVYFTKSFFTMLVITLPVCAARGIINMFYLIAVWSDFNIGGALLIYILPEFIYTVTLAPPVYFTVKFTAGKFPYHVIS